MLTSQSGHRDRSTHEGPPPCLQLLVTMTTIRVGRCPMGPQSRGICRSWSRPILRFLLHWCLPSLLLQTEIGLPQLAEKERLHTAVDIGEKSKLIIPRLSEIVQDIA